MSTKRMIVPKIVTGVFFNGTYAEDGLRRLLHAGFAKENLSVIGGDTDDMRQVCYPLIRSGPDMYLIYASVVGALLGAISAWIAMTFIPGLEHFLSVVPLLAMIAGAVAGACVGFLTGSFIHFDTPTYESTVLVSDKLSGSVLVSVRVNSLPERYKAEAIMEETGAAEVLVEQPDGEEFSALYHPQPQVQVHQQEVLPRKDILRKTSDKQRWEHGA